MSGAARRGMTVDEFYEFISANPDERYEFVDGEPVMMAGANRRHDRIAGNAFRLVSNHLLGHRCQPFTSDTYISIPDSPNRRQPDLGIDCGPFVEDSLEAAEPTLVVEILSPTIRTFDRQDKTEEYKTVKSPNTSCLSILTFRRCVFGSAVLSGDGLASV